MKKADKEALEAIQFFKNAHPQYFEKLEGWLKECEKDAFQTVFSPTTKEQELFHFSRVGEAKVLMEILTTFREAEARLKK